MKRRGTLLTKLGTMGRHYRVTVSVSTSLRSSVRIVPSVVGDCGTNGSVICNMHGRQGASAFFGHGATLIFCQLVGTVKMGSICGRTSCHLVDRQTVRRLYHFHRHGLFLQKLIPLVNCRASDICCGHSGHFTKRSGCPFQGVLGFTVSNVASFSIGPIHVVF